jgi:hypothetical protein
MQQVPYRADPGGRLGVADSPVAVGDHDGRFVAPSLHLTNGGRSANYPKGWVLSGRTVKVVGRL